MLKIMKRDGTLAKFDSEKIAMAVKKAFAATNEVKDEVILDDAITSITVQVTELINRMRGNPSVEDIQDEVERALMNLGYPKTAKAYIVYRAERTRVRESNSVLMQKLSEIIGKDAKDSDSKRDNANVDGNAPMGTMLQIGSAASKAFYENTFLSDEQAAAFRNGDIHIHDFDFYALTTTCCQIDLIRLFNGGFSTGHGYLREPNSIMSYAALAAIAIQSNQNDQHGGQGIPNFEYAMALGVRKTYRKELVQNFCDIFADTFDVVFPKGHMQDAIAAAETAAKEGLSIAWSKKFHSALIHAVSAAKRKDILPSFSETACNNLIDKVLNSAERRALRNTERLTHQAMESFIHNLNSMHSRAGAQTPFSSINYGTDTSPEGRLIIQKILQATEEGLGNGETPIFPIQIFRVKEGVNYNPGDPNYDLFQYSMKVSAKRLFPNYLFLDAPFNLQYYKPDEPETFAATMGCRTRVMANLNGPEIAYSRGNLSFTTINLPRLAIEAKGDIAAFFAGLEKMLKLTSKQLLDRFEIQAKRKVMNYPFLMGQGVWLDSDKLDWNDEVREVLKHGTLSIGFIGLAEALVALYGHHHGESAEMQKKGLSIIRFMRAFCDEESKRTNLNFSLLATPAEGLSGRFTRMDRERYGEIEGVTDREYYTNSFHVPVYFPISAYDKIQIEAPYHTFTNAGHITYIEMDGDPAQNLKAFEAVIRCMKESGIGYGSINHPVDRDPVCGYVGIIGDVCPRCGRHAGEAVSVEKLNELRKTYPDMPQFPGTN